MSEDLVQSQPGSVPGDAQMSEDFTTQEAADEAPAQGEIINTAPNNSDDDFSMFLDINVMLAIEIGSKQMKINDLMKLNKGSVIELDKAAGDPLDIKANGSLIARGEVVIANGKYGIRLTEVVSKNERSKSI